MLLPFHGQFVVVTMENISKAFQPHAHGRTHCSMENQESEPSHRCEYHEGGFAKAGILLLYNDWVTLCLVLEKSWSIIGVIYAVSTFTLLESYMLSPWCLHCEVGFYTG